MPDSPTSTPGETSGSDNAHRSHPDSLSPQLGTGNWEPGTLPRVSPTQLLILLLILLTATLLRTHRLATDGMWLDELYTVQASAGRCYHDLELPRDQIIDPPPHLLTLEDAPPFSTFWTSFAEDQHPPLYFILVRLWRETFGSSDASIRGFSVLCSVAVIPFLFDAGRLLLGAAPALWACTTFTLAQVQLIYAQEARAYSLLLCLTTASLAAALRLQRLGPTTPRLLALSLFTLAACLTHYFAIAPCLVIAIFLLTRTQGRTRRLALLSLATAALLFLVIWAPMLYRQTHGFALSSDWMDDHSKDPRLLALLRRIARVPVLLFAEPYGRHPGPLPYAFAALLVLPAFRLRRVPGLVLPCVMVLACIALPAAADLLRHNRSLEFVRYTLPAAPALYLCAAGLLADNPRRVVRHALPTALALYCIAAIPWAYERQRPEWWVLGQNLAAEASDRDLIVYYAPTRDWYASALYLPQERYASGLHAPVVIATRPLAAGTLARAHAARTVWLASEPGTEDADSLLPGFRPVRQFLQHGCAVLTEYRPADTDTNSTPTTRDTKTPAQTGTDAPRP